MVQKIEEAQVEEETDLMSIGDHCNVCQQLDFLPYKCSGCQLHFCSEHRLPASHSCTNPPNDAKEVVVCPVCAKAITVPSGMDPNLAFERHSQSTACDSSNYMRVHKKKKCPVKGCREKLTTLNSFDCKSCGESVCLRHRLPTDHSCTPRSATAGSKGLPWTTGIKNIFAHSSRSLQHKTSSISHRKEMAQSNPRQQQARYSEYEACPHCGANFDSPAALVAHVESRHLGQTEICVLI